MRQQKEVKDKQGEVYPTFENIKVKFKTRVTKICLRGNKSSTWYVKTIDESEPNLSKK